jgi:hypothetical protein
MNFARNSSRVKMWQYSLSKILIPSLKDGSILECSASGSGTPGAPGD